jgi:hypothetical protein
MRAVFRNRLCDREERNRMILASSSRFVAAEPDGPMAFPSCRIEENDNEDDDGIAASPDVWVYQNRRVERSLFARVSIRLADHF